MNGCTPLPIGEMSCCEHDPSALSVTEAQRRIIECIQAIDVTETVPIREALGRVLQSDMISPLDHPPQDNSAMDGYAVRAEDVGQLPTTLNVIGKALAGQPFTGRLQTGEAVRIMTGASLPAGADAVIPQEQIETSNGSPVSSGPIQITHNVKVQQHVRLRGEDIQTGHCVLGKNTLLNEGCVALLSSMGIGEVLVTRKIKVVIFSTGDELQSLGEPLQIGNIYDSNRYALRALLQNPAIEIIEKGILDDNAESMQHAVAEMQKQADVIISTGGVSVGDADWVKSVVRQLGEVIFWRVNMKPGRPLLFAKLGKTWFFGLPGNPVSVMTTFLQFVDAGLVALSGQAPRQRLSLRASSAQAIKKRTGRMELQRGIAYYNQQGELWVKSTGAQGSGILSSMAHANCLIVLDEACSGIEQGDEVTIQPLSLWI